VRPFRFGVQLSTPLAGRTWRETARQVESLGYSTLFIPDHFGDQLAPMVALAAAAEATTTLRVGPLVLDNDYRHPLVTAKEAATLDVLSGGRLELGIGAGWMRTDYDEAGLAYDRPGVRVDRLVEAVAILKGLWSQEKVDWDGTHYHLSAAQGLPRPVTEGGPPLLIGGGSPRVLGLAGREADIVGVNPNLVSGAIDASVAADVLGPSFDRKVAWVREAAGSRLADIDLQCLCFVVQVGTPRDQALAQLAPYFSLSVEEAADVPIALAGTVEEVCSTLEARRERWGFNYVVVHEAELESFAPVVGKLTGR
jgi:probable F420-dependent oxidoreductase